MKPFDLDQARAAREARIAQREREMQAAREEAHSQAREAYKAEMRAAYSGSDADFREYVWPEKRAKWEADPARDAVEVTKQDLLRRHQYHGF